ncbi:hypothetical protein SAMN04488096_104102 [Mesonia phycicola]|uniref:Uncharacterized protein n=1 Tax=Mesonia phycicola TaxID=579105 RepID=A0A1M6DQ72_9FLAO|nr:hypothetical protein SAMN04488096_104102 [Mesonia phycicola]
MKLKNAIFAIATLGFLVTSCTPQSIDEHTTQDNIQNDDFIIDKGKIKIPTNG